MDPELQRYLKSLTRIASVLMLLGAIYLLFQYIFPIAGKILARLPGLFMPFLFALLLALVIEPVVDFFERKFRFNRSWSVVLSLLLIVGGFFSCLALLISRIIDDMSKLYPQLVIYSEQLTTKIIAAIGDFKLFYLGLNLSPQFQEAIQSNLENAIRVASSLMEKSINSLIHSLAMLPGLVIFLMIATVASFFVIRDRAVIRGFLMQFIPPAARSTTREVVGELFKALTGFLKAYSILISVTAIITMVFLRILGVDYIITIGVVVGLLDILPILGPGAVFVPWIAWEFIMGNIRLGISLLVVYLSISLVRQFLEPKIIGDKIGLHPLATLMSLYIGLKLGGITGMVLGPVLLVIFIASYRAGMFDNFNWRK